MSGLQRQSKIVGYDLRGYPQHHFRMLLSDPAPEYWPIQISFAGLDEYIKGAWRRRENSDTFALEYVLSGEFTFVQNTISYRCQPGDLFIVQLGKDSSMRSATDYATKKTIALSGTLLPMLIDTLKFHHDVIVNAQNSCFDLLYEQVINLLEQRPDRYCNELSQLAYRILLELSQFCEQNNAAYPAELTAILSFLQANFCDKITVNYLCQRFKLSSRALYRLFQVNLQQSPIDYLISLRLKHAANLLTSQSIAIKNIASAVGYNNPLYFSEEFKRHYGRSPRDYRREK